VLQAPDSSLIKRRYQQEAGDRAEPEAGSRRPELSVGFVLTPRFTLMALAGFVEALRHAADINDRSRQIRCAWSIIAPTYQPVISSCGVAVTPWKTLEEPAAYDYLAVVGGLLSAHESDLALARYLNRAADRGIPLIGLCTGSFVLARAGLMDGRRCCVSYYHAEEFQREFGSKNIDVVADSLFVFDGPRITCAGGLGAVDLALHLLERHVGAQQAQKSVAQMLLPDGRPPSAPQPRINTAWYSSVRNPTVRRAILLMELHFSAPISIGAVAEHLCIGVKQLERVFGSELGMAPAMFYRKMRLDAARCMLDETTRPITSVALDCGFSDISHFGRLFRSVFGSSPRHYRQNLHRGREHGR
jgi:transcriptional regulator GlxA family with amidase domain